MLFGRRYNRISLTVLIICNRQLRQYMLFCIFSALLSNQQICNNQILHSQENKLTSFKSEHKFIHIYIHTQTHTHTIPRSGETPKQQEGSAESRATAPSDFEDRNLMCKQNTRQCKEQFNNSNPDFTVTEQTAHITHMSFLFRSVLYPSMNPLGHFKHTPPIATGTVRSRKSVFPH